MKPATQAVLYGWIVVILILWSILHFSLVQLMYWNPWKLYGMAMYSTAHMITVGIIDTTNDTDRVIHLDEVSPELRKRIEHFAVWTNLIGTMAPFHNIASAVKEEMPQVQSVVLERIVKRLNPRTGLLEETVLQDAFFD